jgi:hypothetical protein
MTIRTTVRAGITALAIATMTFGGAALTPAAAGGGHGHGFHHGFHGFHGKHFGFGHFYPGFYGFNDFNCWKFKKIFVPGAGFVVKKFYFC